MTRDSRTLASALMALLVALLLVGSTTAQMPADAIETTLADIHIAGYDTQDGHDALLAKAGPVLIERLNDGQTAGFEVILTGPPHNGIVQYDFPDRSAAMAELGLRTAPFFALVEALTERFDGEVVASWSAANAIKVTGDLPLVEVLAALEPVRHIALDHVGAVTLVEDVGVDPIPDEARIGNSEGRTMLEAEEVWAAGFEGEGIKIAIIDSGIDASHEAFKHENGTSRVTKFVDCQSGGCTAMTPYDDNGHGTHVGATAAGSDVYDDPVHGTFQETGVAPKADLFGVKFLSATGGGSFQGAMDSLQWSFDNDADLTSNSWGGSCSASSSVVQLVNQLTGLGMLNVFSAGNSGTGGIGGPACADTALSVGAVDANYNIASFSSRGPCSDPTTGTGSRICPDVVAKGVAVRSAIPRSGATHADPSGYKVWQGTSMSAPHVSGAVALIEEMKRHYDDDDEGWDTPNQAEKEILKLTALPLVSGGASPNNVYGWGHPELLPILAMLESSDEAKIIDAFSVSNDEVRLGEATTLSFSVRNLGGATATGDFQASLELPDGSVDMLADETVSLGLLDGASVSHTVSVAGNVAPGNYTFTGSFDYTWTNETGDVQTGSVFHEGTFTVKRVFLEMDLDGLEDQVLPGGLQSLVFTMTSAGNEPAFGTTMEFTVSDRYQFVPGANVDPFDANTFYADPAPDRVLEDPDRNRVTLIWDVGDLPEGGSFSFTTQLLPTLPGEHRFLATGKYQDGVGQHFGQSHVWWQTVGL